MTTKVGRPKLHKNGYTHIKVDVETHINLVNLAEPLPLAMFLRYLARKANEDDKFKSELVMIALQVHIDSILSDIPENITVIDKMMIDAAIADNPEVKRVSYYDRQPNGSWRINQKRLDAWLEKENTRRDKLFTEHNMQTAENMPAAKREKIFNMYADKGLSPAEIAKKLHTIPEVIELVLRAESFNHILSTSIREDEETREEINKLRKEKGLGPLPYYNPQDPRVR